MKQYKYNRVSDEEENENVQEEEKKKLLESNKEESIRKETEFLNKTAPHDNYNLAYFCFYMLGIGMLFPFNVFITATSFFKLKFAGSIFADNFNSFFTIGYNVSNMLGLTFLIKLVENSSFAFRVYFSSIATLIIFTLITSLVKIDIDPIVFFVIIMICVIGSGIIVALFQNGMFGLAAKFPGKYTSAVMSGQGFAGTAVSLSQIFSALISDSSSDAGTETSALIYFITALVIIFVSTLSFTVLNKLQIFRHYTEIMGELKGGDDLGISSTTDSRNPSPERESESSSSKDVLVSKKKSPFDEYWQLFKILWDLCISVTLVFFVTLALFPTITSAIESVNEKSESRIFGDLFIPFSFLLFNFGDLVGRSLSLRYQIVPARFMLGLSLSRFVFFFFFLCCNVILRDSQGNIIDKSIPVLFGNDYVYWLLMMIFAISNGYFASLCMMYGPERVKLEDREKAGVVMVYFLVMGLFLGSFFSFALRAILCRCNPFIS